MEYNKYFDHTLLAPQATSAEIDKLIDEGIKYNVKSI